MSAQGAQATQNGQTGATLGTHTDRIERDRLAARLIALRAAAARASITWEVEPIDDDQREKDAQYLLYLAGSQDPRD